MRSPITVLAGQFEDLVAVGLRELISEDPNIRLVATAVPVAEVGEAIENHSPAVALLNFGTLPSAVTVHQLHQAHPDTRIIVLANRPSAAEANQMLSFGAAACISKETEGRDIINAIHLASRGMHVLPRSSAVQSLDGRVGMHGPDLLTPREADVLELLQEGMTNAQIALALSIGVETVRTHARNIYRKLGVSSRRDLARLTRPQPASSE
jgi:DNA-binding NarL/FixJ family response regulator